MEYRESDVVKLIVTPAEANSLFRVSAYFLDNLASVEMIEHQRIYLNSKIASEVCFNPKGVIKDQEVIINSNNMFKYSEVNNSNGDIIKQEIVNEQLEPKSIRFADSVGLSYVSCSPFRIPIARLAAAQAVILNQQK